MDDPMELHDGTTSDGMSVVPDPMDVDNEVIDTSDIEEVDWEPDVESERAASPTLAREELPTPAQASASDPLPTRTSPDPLGLTYPSSPLTQLAASSPARELSPLGDDDVGLSESQDPDDLSHSDPLLYLALPSSPGQLRKLAPFPMLRSSPPNANGRRSASRTSSPEPSRVQRARSVGSPDFFSQLDPPPESPKPQQHQQNPPSPLRNPPRPPTPPLVIPPDEVPSGGRALRPRRQEQLKPYTLEERLYTRATAAVPEARVDQSEVVGEDMQEAQIHDNSRDDDYREPAPGERRRSEGQRLPPEETEPEDESEEEYVDEDESQEDFLPETRRERLQEIRNQERERDHRPPKRRKTAHVQDSSTSDENRRPPFNQQLDGSRVGPSPSTSRQASDVIIVSSSDDEARSSQTARPRSSRAVVDRGSQPMDDELQELERKFRRMYSDLKKTIPAFMALREVNKARIAAGLRPVKSMERRGQRDRSQPIEPLPLQIEDAPPEPVFDDAHPPLKFQSASSSESESESRSSSSSSASEDEFAVLSDDNWQDRLEVPQEVHHRDVLRSGRIVGDYDRVNAMLTRTNGNKRPKTRRTRAPTGTGQSREGHNAAPRQVSQRERPSSHPSASTTQPHRKSIQQQQQPNFLVEVRTAGASRGGQQTYLNFPKTVLDRPESSRQAQERGGTQRVVVVESAPPPKQTWRGFMRKGDLWILEGAQAPVQGSKGSQRVVQGRLNDGQYQQFLAATKRQSQSSQVLPSAGGASAPQPQRSTYTLIPPPRRSINNATARSTAHESQRHGQPGSGRIRRGPAMAKPIVLLEVPEEIKMLSRDFGIKHLEANRKFVDNSKLMQSSLAQLVELVKSGEVSHPELTDYYFMDLHLNKDFTGEQLVEALPTAFDSVYDWMVAFEKDLLSATDRAKDVQRVFEWLVRFLARSADADIIFDSLVDQALAFVVRLEDSVQRYAEPSVHVLAALWFCVELATVACFHPSLRDRNQHVDANAVFIKAAITRLVMQLLNFGFERTMKPLLRKDKLLDPTKPAEKAIECWICLIHTLETIKASSVVVSPQNFDIWLVVADHWQVVAEGVKHGIQRGELIWRSIFGLCAISQFSTRGMSSRKANLAVSSDAVMAALNQLDLNERKDDKGKTIDLDPQVAVTRDALIRVLLDRCNVIHNRSLFDREQAKPVVSYFMTTFRSRDWSNLIDEEPEFPMFILAGDRIAAAKTPTEGDPTFAVLLQFCLRVWHGAPASEVDWLISQIPLISLAWNKEEIPSVKEQSKYINRICACIVIIWLLPKAKDLGRMLIKAKSYVRWINVHPRSRALVIRALMLIGVAGKQMGFSPNQLFDWADEMIYALLKEIAQPLVKNSQTNPSKAKRKSLAEQATPDQDPKLHLAALFRALEYILEVKTENDENPMSPQVLLGKGWVELIFSDKTDHGRVSLYGLRELINCVLRLWHVQCAPSVDVEVEAETQEDTWACMDDWVDGLDQGIYQMANTLLPLVRDLVASRFTTFGTNKVSEQQRLVDLSWIDTLAGLCQICAANQEGQHGWAYFIDSDFLERLADADCRQLVQARFIFAMLSIAPHKYTVWREKTITSLLSSLTYCTPTFEHSFLTRVLNLDNGETPLLQSVPFHPGPDLDIESDELGLKRLIVLNAILRQCDQLIVAASEAQPENMDLRGKSVRLSEAVTKMLLLVKAQNSNRPATDAYNEFARGFFNAVRSCPRLSAVRDIKDRLDSGFR